MQVPIRDVHTMAMLASCSCKHSTLLSSLCSFRIRTDDRTWRRRHVDMEWETQICARLQVNTATLLMIQVFWDMTPCMLCVYVVLDVSGNSHTTQRHIPKDLNPQMQTRKQWLRKCLFCNRGVSRGGGGRVVPPSLAAKSNQGAAKWEEKWIF
jgi:hypothetical protein